MPLGRDATGEERAREGTEATAAAQGSPVEVICIQFNFEPDDVALPGASWLNAINSDVPDACVVPVDVGVVFFEVDVVHGQEVGRAKAIPVEGGMVDAACVEVDVADVRGADGRP